MEIAKGSGAGAGRHLSVFAKPCAVSDKQMKLRAVVAKILDPPGVRTPAMGPCRWSGRRGLQPPHQVTLQSPKKCFKARQKRISSPIKKIPYLPERPCIFWESGSIFVKRLCGYSRSTERRTRFSAQRTGSIAGWAACSGLLTIGALRFFPSLGTKACLQVVLRDSSPLQEPSP